jgi:hypothetical protein
MMVMAAGPVSAGNIVLEAYTGQRPADANRLLGPVLEELSARGFIAGDSVARQIEGQVSRPAQTGTGLPGDFAAQVDKGFKLWVAAKFDDAIKVLSPLVAAAHDNTGAFVKNPSLREPLSKALIGLAIAQMRTGDPSTAKTTFGELARAFPETVVSRGVYGPDAATMFDEVKRELAASTKGKLTVKAADDGAVVFVDEVFRGTSMTELAPGEYRVSVMLNSQPSRSHKVSLRAGDDKTIAIDARLDQALHTEGWTGFSFVNDADRDAHEGPYASQLAASLNASAVAVVGIESVKGRSAVVGSLVSLSTGREIRRASVAMDRDPSTDRLKALARYLAGEEATGGIEVQPIEAGAPEEPKGGGATTSTVTHDAGEPARGGRWGGWKWITGGVAVGGLATGAVLVAFDGRCSNTPPAGTLCNVYDTKNTGFIALGAGAVFAGVSIYLFATQPSHPAKTAFVAPTSDGAIAGVAGSW